MTDPASPLLLIAALAHHLRDPAFPQARHIAIGAASPIPAAAALLARAQGADFRISLLHRRRGNPFTEGSRELFDLAGQGRIDLFFLGGGEIDGEANINLIGTGPWPGREVRFPGSFGSAFMYFMVPRIILFREEHSPRTLVRRVQWISAPGQSPPGHFRRGGAEALLTGRAFFHFREGRFHLVSLHPGETLAGVREATGFAFEAPHAPPETPPPTAEEIRLLRTEVAPLLAADYPAFAPRLLAAASET
jgi:glutaconate CoA-transferase subunit B